jgi:uncharacterized membrane protein
LTVRVLDGLAGVIGAGLLGCILFGWWRPEEVLLAGLVVIAIRAAVAPIAMPPWPPRRVLWALVGAYTLGMSFVSLTRHYTLLTHALDLGYYVQLTWNLTRGAGPRVSLPEMHAWGDHLSPIMYLLVPPFWLAPGASVLLVLQSAILALGGVPVFALARRRLGDERLALAFAALYLVNPTLHGINVRDFHAAALAIPLLLAAMAAADAGRPLPCAAALALALACREDAAIGVVGFGIWLAVGRGRWRAGAGAVAAALGVLWIDVQWLIPHFRGEAYSHLHRYTAFGGSLAEVMLAPVLHPVRTARLLLTRRRLVYLAAMLAPLAFLPLLGPLELLGALPGLMQNLLSLDPVLFHHRTPYQSWVLPFVVVGAVAGYARLARRRPGPWPRRALTAAALLSLALSSRTINQFGVERWWPSPERRAVHRMLAQVPPDVPVSAQDQYVPHLAQRPLIFVFPVSLERAEVVVINEASYPWRSLPGVTMRRDGATVTIEVPRGGPGPTIHRFHVTAEAPPHLVLRR